MSTPNWRKCSTSKEHGYCSEANGGFNYSDSRERENHSAHLASIEAELDSQVAKVEAAARKQAQQDFEAERRAMQEKMETEVQELQTHLRWPGSLLVLQKVASELHPKVRNHGEGPY